MEKCLRKEIFTSINKAFFLPIFSNSAAIFKFPHPQCIAIVIRTPHYDWWKSNFVQHNPMLSNIVQHGGQTCWIHLAGPLGGRKFSRLLGSVRQNSGGSSAKRKYVNHALKECRYLCVLLQTNRLFTKVQRFLCLTMSTFFYLSLGQAGRSLLSTNSQL